MIIFIELIILNIFLFLALNYSLFFNKVYENISAEDSMGDLSCLGQMESNCLVDKPSQFQSVPDVSNLDLDAPLAKVSRENLVTGNIIIKGSTLNIIEIFPQDQRNTRGFIQRFGGKMRASRRFSGRTTGGKFKLGKIFLKYQLVIYLLFNFRLISPGIKIKMLTSHFVLYP